MSIRVAEPADFEEITRVWEASVRATHDFLPEAAITELRPLVLKNYLPAVDLRVHVDAQGQIRGFVGVADGRIEMLFLAPDARGQGIGRQLLQFAITRMSASFVDVNEQNPQALGFYRHMGFEVYDRSPLDGQGNRYPLLHMRLATSENESQQTDETD